MIGTYIDVHSYVPFIQAEIIQATADPSIVFRASTLPTPGAIAHDYQRTRLVSDWLIRPATKIAIVISTNVHDYDQEPHQCVIVSRRICKGMIVSQLEECHHLLSPHQNLEHLLTLDSVSSLTKKTNLCTMKMYSSYLVITFITETKQQSSYNPCMHRAPHRRTKITNSTLYTNTKIQY